MCGSSNFLQNMSHGYYPYVRTVVFDGKVDQAEKKNKKSYHPFCQLEQVWKSSSWYFFAGP